MRLLTGGPAEPDSLGEGARRMILRDTGSADLAALLARVTSLHHAAAAVIDHKLEALP